MDWGNIPAIAQNFAFAAHMAAPPIAYAATKTYALGHDVWVGATHEDSMDSLDRNMQFAKMGSAGLGFIMSVFARSPHGIVAGGVTLADTFIRLARAGRAVKQREPEPVPTI